MRRKTYKRKRGLKGGKLCPPGTPVRICSRLKEKWERIGMDPEYIVTRNFKENLAQTVRNRERRLIPEDERVAELRKSFNWKKRHTNKYGRINNNLNNINIQNIHEATNINFPANTGKTPAAFLPAPAFTHNFGKQIRKKIYRNNSP